MSKNMLIRSIASGLLAANREESTSADALMITSASTESTSDPADTCACGKIYGNRKQHDIHCANRGKQR